MSFIHFSFNKYYSKNMEIWMQSIFHSLYLVLLEYRA